jgi:hypothetical protein
MIRALYIPAILIAVVIAHEASVIGHCLWDNHKRRKAA